MSSMLFCVVWCVVSDCNYRCSHSYLLIGGDTQTVCFTTTGAVYGWGCYRDKEGKKFFHPDYSKDGGDYTKDVKKQQNIPMKIEHFEGSGAKAGKYVNNVGVNEIACGSCSCLVRLWISLWVYP